MRTPAAVATWERIMVREWQVVARPQRPAGAPMLRDVFEGLQH